MLTYTQRLCHGLVFERDMWRFGVYRKSLLSRCATGWGISYNEADLCLKDDVDIVGSLQVSTISSGTSRLVIWITRFKPAKRARVSTG